MPAGSGDNKHEGWNTIPPFLAGPGHHVQQCIEPKVATLQDPIPSRVDFLMDHSMGWLSRFFSTKSGGTFPGFHPAAHPMHCETGRLWRDWGTQSRQQHAWQALDRDQCSQGEEGAPCVCIEDPYPGRISHARRLDPP